MLLLLLLLGMMMAAKLDGLVAEDEIREAFCVFDIVRKIPGSECITNICG